MRRDVPTIRPCVPTPQGDAAGDTVQVYEYDVYGQVAASDPNHPNRFLFTGREFDKETGLYYYRARYYNASIGRFLQTDPIGYGDGLNWYAYCDNNTTNSIDPSGLFGWTVLFYDPFEKDPQYPENSCLFEHSLDDFTFAIPMTSTQTVLDALRGIIARMNAANKERAKHGQPPHYLAGVYFADHSNWRSNDAEEPYGLEFGNDRLLFSNGADEPFYRELGAIVPSDTMIHFRHCGIACDAQIGLEEPNDASILGNLARWTGHTVTGSVGEVAWNGEDDNDPTKADYYCWGGKLKAKPVDDGKVEISPYTAVY